MSRGPGFVETMFNESHALLAPLRTEDPTAGNVYVSWKIDETPAYIPELEEVRDEVVEVIRRREARKLAQQAAQQLAEKANAAGDTPLTELVPDDRQNLVQQDVGPFPWMMWFGPGMPAFMGNVPQLNNVGEQFMRVAFTQPVGSFGVAPNEPRDTYYVVKTEQRTPPVEQLRERFLNANERSGINSLADQEVREIVGDFFSSYEEQVGLEWNEQP